MAEEILTGSNERKRQKTKGRRQKLNFQAFYLVPFIFYLKQISRSKLRIPQVNL